MFNYKLICVVIFLFNLHQIRSKISDKRLCANENCTEPISLGKTMLRYPSPEHKILSFEANADVTVFSKEAGSNTDLWGVEINGKRGYAPRSYIREMKVYKRNLTYLVDTELSDKKVPSIKADDIQETIKANKVPDYDVYYGTTIYSDDTIIPTPTGNNVLPTAVEQNLEENILNTDVIKESPDATQLLDPESNKFIKDEHKKLETIENIQSDSQEKGDVKLIKGNELKEDDISEDNNVGIDGTSQVHGDKESIVENVLQTITNWMNDETNKNDKDSNPEEYAVADGEDEDNEEEEEEEDDDDYEDDDSEEIDASGESDISTTKVDSENKQQISDVSEKNDSTNVDTEDAVNGINSDFPSDISKENIEEENKIVSVETPTLKSINLENTVKTRQLLSEEDMSNRELIRDISQKEDNVENMIHVQKDEGQEEITSVDSKEVLDSEILNTKDRLDNVDSLDIPIIDKNYEESTTESTLTEIPSSELPPPLENEIQVTASPIENDENNSLTESEIKTANDEQVIVNNTNEDSLSSLENQKETQTPSDESENVGSQDTGDHNIVESTDEVGNTENLYSSDSPKVVGTDQSLQAEDDDFNHESKDAEHGNSSEQPLSVDNENVDANETPSAVDSENVEESKSPEVNMEKEAAITTTDEVNGKQVSGIISSSEDQLDKSSELNEEPLKGDKEDILPQENLSGIFSGITNWLGKVQNQNIIETVNKDETSSVKESVADENLNQENNFQNIDDTDTSEKQDNNVNKNTIGGDHTSNGDKVETVEQHDHGFLSMIEEQHRKSSADESHSSQVEENLAPDETTEVPVSEIIPEETVEIEFPEKILDSQEVLKNQELPMGEINNQEDSQKDDNLHIFDVHDHLLSKNSVDYGSCPAGESDCPDEISVVQKQLEMEQVASGYNFSDYLNLLTLLGATGLSVAIFLLGFITIDKNRKEGTLIAKINTLEKALLVASKENTLLVDRVSEIQNETAIENDRISNDEFERLKQLHQETLVAKSLLEDQIQSLEKELENSTEVGLELNRMLSDIISSQNGSDTLFANVEQLQRQLVEQQSTINTINDTLNLKDTENHELQLELEIKNKKVTHLQADLDKMAMNLFKVEEDKEQMQAKLESEILELKDALEQNKNSFNSARTKLLDEINSLKTKFAEVQRNLEVKTNEYTILKDNFNQIKMIKNNTEALQSLLNASAMKAELQQLQRDNQTLNDVLRQEQETKFTLEKQVEIALQEAQSYKAKYDESDKDKLEAQTKLEVLSNYFKDREGQLQKELSKQESLWVEHQGEATSTIERIKYMQEELQNCKSQNELLKQEIVSQEVELKSQISVLEKKAHESWLIARQAERRLEDAKQEAAQLRNRLTLKLRGHIEDKGQNRIQSPLEQNGDLVHMPVESPASPPLLYGTRDHLTTSPPLPNLPPFLPPPPGVPFMPPPIPGVPSFMPPMFPVDHRPPPLGRMSSPPPPLNSRYSPDSRYSPYDRNSPSPPYDDEYGSSPPHLHRGYSPYNNRDDRRDYKRPPLRSNGRNKGAISSGSGNSNESLEKINRHHSKV